MDELGSSQAPPIFLSSSSTAKDVAFKTLLALMPTKKKSNASKFVKKTRKYIGGLPASGGADQGSFVTGGEGPGRTFHWPLAFSQSHGSLDLQALETVNQAKCHLVFSRARLFSVRVYFKRRQGSNLQEWALFYALSRSLFEQMDSRL